MVAAIAPETRPLSALSGSPRVLLCASGFAPFRTLIRSPIMSRKRRSTRGNSRNEAAGFERGLVHYPGMLDGRSEDRVQPRLACDASARRGL
jgi:hypothetical protein